MNAEDVESASGDLIKPFYRGEVEFKNVSYHYPKEEKEVVKNFNLKVSEGECIAIVGSSGSGKSTIINLVVGLLEPTQGEILVDGRPLKELPMQAYRHYISVVPQNSIAKHLYDSVGFRATGIVEDNMEEMRLICEPH
jgi:ABC-type bacteriocin/lantibiotic exporter with double-glycine peptidase domain